MTKEKISTPIRESVQKYIVNCVEDAVDGAITANEAAEQICDRVYGLREKRLTKEGKSCKT